MSTLIVVLLIIIFTILYCISFIYMLKENISRDLVDGEIIHTEDGVYVYSEKEKKLLCLDKQIDTFNETMKKANYKDNIIKRWRNL